MQLIRYLDTKNITLLLILLVALFLGLYKITEVMPLIGDQGWFYLSARDLILNKDIPLVGITSSHTWLNQGPIWTYLLAIPLFLSSFNPVSGAILSVFFYVAVVVLMYVFGKRVIGFEFGALAAILYALSPLVIFHAKFPYHTSPIPFFTMSLVFLIYEWLKGRTIYFPLIIFNLGILYNLELATFIFPISFALFLIYGFLKKKVWIKKILNKEIILLSILLLVLSMLPIIIFDINNGFRQTVVFTGWVISRPFSYLFGESTTSIFKFPEIMNFLIQNLSRLLFVVSPIISLVIFLFSIISILYLNTKKKVPYIINVVLFFFLITFVAFLANMTPSEAYLPMFFPLVIIITSYFIYLCFKEFRLFTMIIIVFLLSFNVSFSKSYDYGISLVERLYAVDEIIRLADGQEYNLIGKGKGSEFKSYTMNYEYLLWWKGHPPSKKDLKNKIVVEDRNGEVLVTK